MKQEINLEYISGEVKEKTMLLSGAQGALGSAVIKNAFQDYNIVAVDRKRPDVPDGFNGCFIKLNIADDNLTGKIESLLELLIEKRLIRDKTIDANVFALAFGKVGMHADKATEKEIEQADKYSINPFINIVESLNPRKSVAYSTLLEIYKEIYGAMYHSKMGLESYSKAFQRTHDSDLIVIRGGNFESASQRMIIESVKKTDTSINTDSGVNVFQQKEMKEYGNTRPTTAEDMAKLTMRYLRENTYDRIPILSVVGGRIMKG